MDTFKKASTLMLALIMVICSLGIVGFAAEIDKANYNTSWPNEILDFTNPDTYEFTNIGGASYTDTENGFSFVAEYEDPQSVVGPISSKACDMQFMVMKYSAISQTGHQRKGEVYFETENFPIDETRKSSWTYAKVDGTWTTQVIKLKTLAKVDEEVITFRFDPLAHANEKVLVGDSIEIAYMAFFSNEEDAAKFDYSEYIRYQEDLEKAIAEEKKEELLSKPFTKPAYKEIAEVAGDNIEGTLSYKSNGDGTLTVSYKLNGKDVSYTVPDTIQMRNGPLAGKDDLGRVIGNQFTEIDPDYTSIDENDVVTTIDEKTRAIGVYGENGERYIGIFYFLWLGTKQFGKTRNLQQLINEYGGERLGKDESLFDGENSVYFFDEPFYGYYSSKDEWVIRKHMELLSNAGVDFLYFDTTNNYAYIDVVKRIIEVCHQMNEEGFSAPKIVFYTNYKADIRVKEIYNGIYKKNLYPDTWFLVDGKPLIIAPEAANIDNFFTIRLPQWPNVDKLENSWPWIDGQWPQDLYGPADRPNEAINVSVAQHSGNWEFSTSIFYGYKKNRGRSFDGTYDKLTSDSYKLGLNLQNQFNRAISTDAKYVLVTGWNEWVAARQPSVGDRIIRFVDTISDEYSRDIEMMRGGYFDNYYMQLVANIAAVKGAVPVVVRDDRHLINPTGSFAQWDSVIPKYSDPSDDMLDRDAYGSTDQYYKDESGNNDIVGIKVTNDTKNISFLVECKDDIKRADSKASWLQILLNTDGGQTGFGGYKYIVNYALKDDTSSYLGVYDGKNGEYAYKRGSAVPLQVEGNKMMVSVPLEELGIKNSDEIYIEFKVVDGKEAITSFESFYEKGDVAPLGRLNYVYQTYIPGIQNSGNNKSDNVKATMLGIGIGIGAAVIAAAAAVTIIVLKKKKNAA